MNCQITKRIRRAIDPRSRVASYLLLFAGLMPIVLVAWYVAAYGRSVPVGDQWWDTVYIAVKTKAGILTPEDILVRSAGHRLAIIRLVAALSTILTDYAAGPLLFTSFLFALLNLGLAMLLLSASYRRLPAAFFLFAVLLFTLYNADNWLDMYFSQHQQALFFVLMGLTVLQRMRPSWLAFVLLILCATAASLSQGAGLAAWICLPAAALGISAYRRARYAVLWLAALTSLAIFYFSNYAVDPYNEGGSDAPSLSRMLHDGYLSPVIFLIRFQAARFYTNPIVGGLADWFTLACTVVLGLNLRQTIRASEKEGVAIATLWGSLALFAVGIAVLILLGRGAVYPVRFRYSPGGDGFWLAFIALALLVLSKRPPAPLAVLNVLLLVTMVIFTTLKDGGAIPLARDGLSARCEQTVLDLPLYRDDSFRKCFVYSDDQSVYHLAALRLSVFRDEKSELILPRADAPVITDLPNRWVSVYVREYMMAGVGPDKLYSIAPSSGEWLPMNQKSPFYRGEWSTDILARPLAQTWISPSALVPDLAIITANQRLIWYLNTPETDAHMAEVGPALSNLGYIRSTFQIKSPRYASARFGLWCFERTGSGACRLQN
jgi:hypothetical protein